MAVLSLFALLGLSLFPQAVVSVPQGMTMFYSPCPLLNADLIVKSESDSREPRTCDFSTKPGPRSSYRLRNKLWRLLISR